MSSSCGISSTSSSIFGGLCSGNNRRPSMFTAKYRLREERKKVLKMSMAKVKRIEDPESFLRRSVLINNTIKRLQREVREEKMMRHGGYTSKLSCSSFRKSYACSRLSDMHLPDDDSMSLSSISRPLSRNNSISNNNNNSRKRPISDDSEDDCDVQAVLSQIYIPPTPCIISSIDDDDCCDSTNDPDSLPAKKAKLSLSADASSLLVSDECSLDVDVDVDVVGDSETSDWPTPPEPINSPPGMLCSSGLQVSGVMVNDTIDHSSIEIDSSVVVANCLSQATSVDGIVGDSDCEFSLDLAPTLQSSLCNVVSSMDTIPSAGMIQVTGASIATEARQMSSQSQERDDLEDMTSDTKENTCTIPSSCCSSTTNTLIPSTMDRKCTDQNNHSSVMGGGGGSPISNVHSSLLSPQTDMSTSSSSSSASSADKQYSSCGHSSIFGELQSVVFHSLIASLET